MIREHKLISNLPTGWVITNLGEICNSVKGKKPKNYITEIKNGYSPYILVEQMEGGEPKIYTDDKDCPKCTKNDVLIVWDGSIGKCAIGLEGAIGSTIVSLKTIGFNPKYLSYFINYIQPFIQSTSRGTGLQHINPQVFWNLLFPLSPLPEQNRIVTKIEELLTKLDASIKALQYTKVLLKQYRNSILEYAFKGKLTEEWRKAHKDVLEPASVLLKRIKEEQEEQAKNKLKESPVFDTSDLPELPEGWEWTRLNDIIDILTDYHANGSYKILKAHVQLLDNPDYALMVRTTNLGNHDFENSTKFISESAYNFLWKSKVFGDEVIFGKIGNAGKVYLMPNLNRPCSLGMNLFLIRFYKPILSRFVYFNLLTAFSAEQIRLHVKGVGNPTIDKKSIRSLIIVLSSFQEQQEIIKEIERHFSLADEIEKTIDQSLKQSESLRQSILKKAFEGKLVPQDPNDEPADTLLERIKVEKAIGNGKETAKKS